MGRKWDTRGLTFTCSKGVAILFVAIPESESIVIGKTKTGTNIVRALDEKMKVGATVLGKLHNGNPVAK